MNKTISLRDHVGDLLNKHDCARMYVLDSDLSSSTTSSKFSVNHPERFIECGISEQSGLSIATGLALEGMIPFYVNFAIFCTGTAWTQLRMACYAGANIKLIGTHPGTDNGPDGASHHANEDLALARAIPGLTVLVPDCLQELDDCIAYAVKTEGPIYIRCARDNIPEITPVSRTPFQAGKAVVVRDEGRQVAIIYEGSAAGIAAGGYQLLREKKIYGKLINIRSIKPLDKQLIEQLGDTVDAIVTVENHTVLGGLAGAVSEVLAARGQHAPLAFVGIEDAFTESGKTADVKHKYHLSAERVAEKARELLARR